jgi:predicted phosphodiesterase
LRRAVPVAGKNKLRVGLIADTHGLLRPEAKEFLRTSDYIVHAGDIGDGGILRELETIARVTAVRGNNDTDAWAAELQETELLKVGALAVYVIHDLASTQGARDRAVSSCPSRSGSSSSRGSRPPRASSILPTHGFWRAFKVRAIGHTLIGSFNPLI